jgi:uncharacterized protein
MGLLGRTAKDDDPGMNMKEGFGGVKEACRRLLEQEAGAHGWDHAERVWRLCRHIGALEGADLEVLELAAILHDIGRSVEKASGGKVCHARAGAERARGIMEEQGLSPATVARVVHCIATHRFRGENSRPETLEARVLFDADKLDALGAVGVGRAFLFAGEVGARLHNPEVDIARTRSYSREDTAYREFSVKLRKVRDRMLTGTGRRMAEDRHAFMESFFRRLDLEVSGDR